MILRRKEAVILSSFLKFLTLSEEDKKTSLYNTYEKETASIDIKNYYIRKRIEYRFKLVTNSYLQIFLSNQLKKEVEVVGKNRKLVPCLCCGYKTLEGIGWEICHVCFWEDDVREPEKYSGANRMTLNEAKENFRKFGVSKEYALESVDPDRLIQFEKHG